MNYVQQITDSNEVSADRYKPSDINSGFEILLQECSEHKLWHNPLLKDCAAGLLDQGDFQVLFEQHYFYARNFTRLLAAVMMNCEDDYYRARLSENLWEEAGMKDVEERHSTLFYRFLHDHLNIESVDKLECKPHTKMLCEKSLHYVAGAPAIMGASFMSFGVEGIVARLYSILVKGMLNAGLRQEYLGYFALHIGCDDEHAETLKALVAHYAEKSADGWLGQCRAGMNAALDLRDEFFQKVYEDIHQQDFNALVRRISLPQPVKHELSDLVLDNCAEQGDELYSNQDRSNGINFFVTRLNVAAEVMDPRILSIPVESHNEYHSHAHETLFYVLEGNGEVKLDNQCFPISAGDMVYVPRWVKHQSRNTGAVSLKILAVTDYGLTRLVPSNSETSYRTCPENAAFSDTT